MPKSFDRQYERQCAEQDVRYDQGRLPCAREAFEDWKQQLSRRTRQVHPVQIINEKETLIMCTPQAENTNAMALGTDDRLAVMYRLQDELDKRVGADHALEQQSRSATIFRLQGLVRAARHECIELEDSTCWKWWRPASAQPLDLQNIKVEIIDLQHFVMSMGLTLGMSLEDYYSSARIASNLFYTDITLDRMLVLFREIASQLENMVGGGPVDFKKLFESNEFLQYLVADMQSILTALLECTPWHWGRDGLFVRSDACDLVGELQRIVIKMGLAIGMNAHDFCDAYEMKMAVNHQRQDSGYVVKNENDCQHI